MAIQLNIGHCYLELKQYDEALNYYFKVELLGNAGSRAWRPIAWCAFLSRKYNVARDYYARVLEKKPSAHDYLNAGHVEVCVGNMKRGVEFYLQSKQKAGDMELFQAMLYDDEKELKEAGVDTAILPIILDAMRYEEEKSDRDPAQE
jgi:tetratricopeptide (TPR) repeat protein